MKNFLKGMALMLGLILIIAAASRARYVGVFVGDGAGVTNVPSGSVSGYGTIAYSNAAAYLLQKSASISVSNLPAGLSDSNYVGVFYGMGTGVTNVANATNSIYATNPVLTNHVEAANIDDAGQVDITANYAVFMGDQTTNLFQFSHGRVTNVVTGYYAP